jgi:protein SCO1/2
VTSRHLIALMTLCGAALVALLVVALVLRNAANSSATSFDGSIMPAGVRAPDFHLRDQDTRPIDMAQYRGRPVIVTFLYSHCKDTCPVEARLIDTAVRELRRPTAVIAFSVDPAHDTPASVHQFMREQKIVSPMRWVLGSQRQLAPIWKGYAVTPERTDEEHMARIVLIDKQGFQKIGYPFDQTTPDRIAHDVRLLDKQRA